MEPIHVLRPPREAFNKDRRISDLIRKQVEHFQHLEFKLPADLRRTLPQQHIVTEGDAAHYIAAMTRVLQTPASAPGAPVLLPTPVTLLAPVTLKPSHGLALAAVADMTSPTPKRSARPAKGAAPKGKKK